MRSTTGECGTHDHHRTQVDAHTDASIPSRPTTRGAHRGKKECRDNDDTRHQARPHDDHHGSRPRTHTKDPSARETEPQTTSSSSSRSSCGGCSHRRPSPQSPSLPLLLSLLSLLQHRRWRTVVWWWTIVLLWAVTTSSESLEDSSRGVDVPNEASWWSSDHNDEAEVPPKDDDSTSHNNNKGMDDSDDDTAKTNNNDGVLMISLTDGSMFGLSLATGDTLWRRSSTRPCDDTDQTTNDSVCSRLRDPLVSTSTTVSRDGRTAAVPSILDGKVYLTAAVSSSCDTTDRTDDNHDHAPWCPDNDDETTVTAHVRDLVEGSPMVDGRGRLYTATRHSTAVAVDVDTGEIVQSMGPRASRDTEDTNHETGDDDRTVVWMGRVDYAVAIHEPTTGALDVQFTSSELMSVHDMLLGSSRQDRRRRRPTSTTTTTESATKSTTELLSSSSSERDDVSVAHEFVSGTSYSHGDDTDDDGRRSHSSHPYRPDPQEPRYGMIVTPSGRVAYRNPTLGEILWVAPETFATPVAFALDSTSGWTLEVEMVPDAALSDGSHDYISTEMQRQLALRYPDNHHSSRGGGGGASNDNSAQTQQVSQGSETIVGSLPASGQLFAMPLGVTQDPWVDVQPPSSADGTANAVSAPRRHFTAVSRTDAPTLTLPRNQGQQQQQQHAHHHHHEGSTGKYHSHHGASSFGGSGKLLQPCIPGSSHFPRCLSSRNTDLRHPHFETFTADGLESSFEVGEDGGIVPFFHPHYGYQHIPPEHYYTLHHEFNNSRKSYKKLLGILGSWLPPLVALIFVSSFEMGRRKRQKEAEKDASTGSTATNLTKESEKRNVHDTSLIQVDEDTILGHGGHGTLVYKGTLDGRQVAVKRMLKTYHASADREISLLIESDGHPNVVRYFLKEIRGDFVYLALELCDLSLHDLIGIVRSRLENTTKEDDVAAVQRRIFNSTKAILLEIATGVRHLHRLRIVHRDLKPANILLADSRQYDNRKVAKSKPAEPLSEIFEYGNYIAKEKSLFFLQISDMGLGKQLAGQSSYGGGSLLNESSMRGQSNGQSSIVGFGPGSVGWQAPEVMALRLPSDGSVKSDVSTGNAEFSSDMSPIDHVSSVRTSRSVDIFSLGCIFYSTLVPGFHPFGEWYEREANIVHNRPNIETLQTTSPEAYDLVKAMLKRKAVDRLTAKEICEHPFFWSPERRLCFLCDFSDRLENDLAVQNGDSDTEPLVNLLAVERSATSVVGTSWDHALDPDLLKNIQRFRTYDPSSIRDLLRLIRNKHHHFDELPEMLRNSIGNKTEGLLSYFDERFPRLVIHCFHVCQDLYHKEDPLSVKFSIVNRQKGESQKFRASLSLDVNTSVQADNSDNVRTRNQPQNSEPPYLSPSEIDFQSVGGTPTPSSNAANLSPTNEIATNKLLLKTISSIPSENSLTHPAIGMADVIAWQGSTTAKSLQCRGWNRSDNEWERSEGFACRRNQNLVKCAEDPKFRTRLCNHWDVSEGTRCPMRSKGKCIFAHGPVELRVKEPKRHRWGKLVDKYGNTSNNPNHSGGEDTYGAARAIESERKHEGKWKTNKPHSKSRNKKSS